MSVKERIRAVCKDKKMSVYEFEKLIDASNGYVNSIYKSIGIDKLEKIIEIFPNINIEWLLVGRGEMYKNYETVNEQNYKINKKEIITAGDLLDRIEKQSEEIGNLKAQIQQLTSKK
ncbi:MAG TPA: hypothetical protein PLS12_09555 [Bacteroidales bacterium]|nr:hypothetical protein [Bacteroidales bacterium]